MLNFNPTVCFIAVIYIMAGGDDNDFACGVCGKTCGNHHNLLVHERTHATNT